MYDTGLSKIIMKSIVPVVVHLRSLAGLNNVTIFHVAQGEALGDQSLVCFQDLKGMEQLLEKFQTK